ncbi:MAG: 50S ribosomal protein L6, partial [Saccharolobus sp.]
MQAINLKEEILIPDNVKVTVNDLEVKVKGPKGEIVKNFSYAKGIELKIVDGKIILETTFANRRK